MLDIDRIVEDCREALKEKQPEMAARDVVKRLVADPAALMKALGEPTRAGIDVLHRSDDLTILNLVWGPDMRLMPHNHTMWASIGIYGGREDNTFWRRSAEGGLVRLGTHELATGEAVWLGENAIHSVSNPLSKLTAGLHVYGGDFFREGRSEWDPETLEELPYDVDKARRLFEESNARLEAVH